MSADPFGSDDFAIRYAALTAAGDQLLEAIRPTFTLIGNLYRMAQEAGIPESGCEFIVNRYVRLFNVGEGS